MTIDELDIDPPQKSGPRAQGDPPAVNIRPLRRDLFAKRRSCRELDVVSHPLVYLNRAFLEVSANSVPGSIPGSSTEKVLVRHRKFTTACLTSRYPSRFGCSGG
jgi:hypothetical protein